jgi:hypothetical protein
MKCCSTCRGARPRITARFHAIIDSILQLGLLVVYDDRVKIRASLLPVLTSCRMPE